MPSLDRTDRTPAPWRIILNLAGCPRPVDLQPCPNWFNGAPGVLVLEKGEIVTALSIDVEADRIKHIYAVRNPDKLSHLTLPQLTT